MSEKPKAVSAESMAELQSTYFDANGRPVYYVSADGARYWGSPGTAQALGLDPELMTWTQTEIDWSNQAAEQTARALWENAAPAPDCQPYEQQQSRER